MAKKRILASILASLGAFTSSMASKGNINSVKPTINTSISNNFDDWYWERQRIRECYRNRNRTVPKKSKKKFSKSFKDWAEKHEDELILGSGVATIAGELGVVGWELYCVYQDDKIRNVTVKNTKDENSKSNGIYHLNMPLMNFSPS